MRYIAFCNQTYRRECEYLKTGLALTAKLGFTWLLASVIFLLSAALLSAQQTSSVSGTVTDPTGAVVLGARVTLANTNTGSTRSAVSNGDGFYSLPAVAVGTYDVTVAAKGFKSLSETGLKVNVNERLALNFKLHVGSASQTVTVVASAVHLQTNDATVSNVITGKQLQSIAINGRNYEQLAKLSPGAANVPNNGYSGISHLSTSSFGFNGMRAQANGWMIDGSSNDTPGSLTSLDSSPAMDAISQFRVVTSNYSAEFGQAGGAVINVRLKSGTNHFHGSAYEFLRNDALDARQALPYSSRKVPLKLNDFGFTIGGPVMRNKLFFFYSSEWRRLRQGETFVAHTPSQLELNGDFSDSPLSGTTTLKNPTGNPNCVVENQINPSCFDPNAVALLKGGAFPSPNAPGFNNYVAAPSLPSNFDQQIVRVDYTINSKEHLMVHFIREGADKVPVTSQWAGSDFPTISTVFSTPSTNTAIRLTSIISPSLLNVASFNEESVSDNGVPTGAFARPSGYTTPLVFGNNPGNRVPELSFSQGYHGIDPGIWPYKLTQPVWTINDTLTKDLARQSFNIGGMYVRSRLNQPNQSHTEGSFDFNGEFTGNSLADFLLGYPTSYSEASAEITGQFRFNQAAAFVQDQIRATKTLTINLGVRYFFIPHVYSQNAVAYWLPSLWNAADAPTLDSKGNVACDATYSLYPETSTCNLYNGMLFAGTSNPAGIGRSMTKTYYDNFGPRIGIAWQLPGIRNTVLRTGYGVTYYRPQVNDTFNMIGNPPVVQTATFTNSPSAPVKLLDNPKNGVVPPISPVTLVILDPEYKLPTYQQYSFGVQHIFGRNTLLSLMYVGSNGDHLRRSFDENIPRPTTVGSEHYDFNPELNANVPINLFRPYIGMGSLTMSTTDSNSNYNSFQVDFNRELAHGLRFQVAYTLARGYDDSSDNHRCIIDKQSCWARDNPHNQLLVVNYIYELPFFRLQRGFEGKILGGWQLSGITTYADGSPFSVGITGPHIGLAQLPDLTGSITYPKKRSEWFSPNIFSMPAPGHYGTEKLDTFIGPGYADWDLSVSKNVRVTENIQPRFQVDFFNIFNNVNLDNPRSTFGAPDLGLITTSGSPRIMQVGMHLSF